MRKRLRKKLGIITPRELHRLVRALRLLNETAVRSAASIREVGAAYARLAIVVRGRVEP